MGMHVPLAVLVFTYAVYPTFFRFPLTKTFRDTIYQLLGECNPTSADNLTNHSRVNKHNHFHVYASHAPHQDGIPTSIFYVGVRV